MDPVVSVSIFMIVVGSCVTVGFVIASRLRQRSHRDGARH